MLPLYAQKMQEDLERGERNIRDTLAKEPESSPRHQRALRQLAGVLMHTHRFEEAIAVYQLVEHTFADNADYWFELGLCRLLLGQTDSGFAAFSRTMNLEPNRCEGRNYSDNVFFCKLYERLKKLAATTPKGESLQLDKDQLWEEYYQVITRPWRESWGE